MSPRHLSAFVLCCGLLFDACGSATPPEPHDSRLHASECTAHACTDFAGWESDGALCKWKGATVAITGETRDLQKDTAVGGGMIRFLDNESGEPLPLCAKADAGGQFVIHGIPKHVALATRTDLPGGYIPIYQWNIRYDDPVTNWAGWQEDFYALSKVVYDLLGFYGLDVSKGLAAAGGIIVKADTKTKFSGAEATVAGLHNQTIYITSKYLPRKSGGTDGDTGAFGVLNVPTGKQTVEAIVDGKVVGTAPIHAYRNAISYTFVTTTVK